MLSSTGSPAPHEAKYPGAIRLYNGFVAQVGSLNRQSPRVGATSERPRATRLSATARPTLARATDLPWSRVSLAAVSRPPTEGTPIGSVAATAACATPLGS